MLTLSAVAENKGIALSHLEVRIERETVEGKPWETSFAVHVELDENLTRRERAILYNSARSCEVHKLLTGELRFEYDLS